MMRWMLRVVMMSGMRAGIDWWVQRQERKADEAGPDGQVMRQQARTSGKRMRQTMRMMRRFFRF